MSILASQNRRCWRSSFVHVSGGQRRGSFWPKHIHTRIHTTILGRGIRTCNSRITMALSSYTYCYARIGIGFKRLNGYSATTPTNQVQKFREKKKRNPHSMRAYVNNWIERKKQQQQTSTAITGVGEKERAAFVCVYYCLTQCWHEFLEELQAINSHIRRKLYIYT